MILRDLECFRCGIVEVLVRPDDPPSCPGCGATGRFLPSAPFLKLSNDHRYPVNGVRDRGLGTIVYDDRDRERKARARGLIPAGDLTDHDVERGRSESARRAREQERRLLSKALDKAREAHTIEVR